MLAPIDVIFDSNEVGSAQVGGTTDNPVFTLLPAIEDCVGIAVTYANIPFTYYVIDATCNTFTFTVTTNEVAGPPVVPAFDTSYTVTIVPGTYNSINIAIQLKVAILAATGLTVEIFVDSTTSKLIIYRNSTNIFKLTFSSSQKILARILGFNVGTFISSTSQFLDDSDVLLSGVSNVISPNVINLSGPSQMFLDSDLGALIFGSVRNQVGNRGLLGFWPVNSNYQGTIEFVSLNPEIIPMTATKISRLNLSLTLGNRLTYKTQTTSSTTPYLQLNGEPFQIGLRFWKDIRGGVENMDSLGNRSVQVQSNARQFDPKKLKRKDVF